MSTKTKKSDASSKLVLQVEKTEIFCYLSRRIYLRLPRKPPQSAVTETNRHKGQETGRETGMWQRLCDFGEGRDGKQKK